MQARDARVVLGDVEVLKGVSLAVAPGQVVAVVGPNGAGKSTLLNVLSGSLPPRTGSVCLDDHPLATWTPRALARRRAVLPQLPELSFVFSTLGGAAAGAFAPLRCSSPQEDRDVAWACLAETGAGHLAERVYTTLSCAERQRVQLARVLAQIHSTAAGRQGADRYLLLDGSTCRLDSARGTLDVARRAAERGIGVVMILHDANQAGMYGDRVAILAGGRVLVEGPPGEVLIEPAARHALGVPAVVLPRIPFATTAVPQ